MARCSCIVWFSSGLVRKITGRGYQRGRATTTLKPRDTTTRELEGWSWWELSQQAAPAYGMITQIYANGPGEHLNPTDDAISNWRQWTDSPFA